MGDNEQTSKPSAPAEVAPAEVAPAEVAPAEVAPAEPTANISGEKVSVRINLTETDKKMNVKIDKDQLINFINEIIIADNKN